MAQKSFQLDPDVKVGLKYVWEDTVYRVIFPEPFKHIPIAFLTVNDGLPRECCLQAEQFSLEEFYIRVIKTSGGSAVQRWVAWMAVDYE